MSGRTWLRLALLLPLYLLRYAIHSSNDYDNTPPNFSYTPPSFDYTPPPLPSTTPDPTDKPDQVPESLQVEDGAAPDLATAKGDFEPVVSTPGAFFPNGKSNPHVMLGDSAAIGITLADPSVIVGSRWLATWSLSADQALALATANLRQDHVAFEQVEPGLWSTPGSDTIGASRILLVDEIKKLHLKGGPVALIPNRATLLLAGAGDAKGLAAMATRAGDLSTASHPIHTIPLCLSGSVWKECLPKPSAEVQQTLSDLASKGREAVYDDVSDAYQKEVGDDTFIAHIRVVTPDDRPSYTITNWMKDYPSMLPKAEKVGFVIATDPDHPKVLGLAPWARVMKVMGSHLKSNGRLPAYYATGGYFPSDAELKQLQLEPLPE